MKKLTQLDIIKSVRKPLPPPGKTFGQKKHPSKAHPAKKGLDKKDPE